MRICERWLSKTLVSAYQDGVKSSVKPWVSLNTESQAMPSASSCVPVSLVRYYNACFRCQVFQDLLD
jgi:hypothetical protein